MNTLLSQLVGKTPKETISRIILLFSALATLIILVAYTIPQVEKIVGNLQSVSSWEDKNAVKPVKTNFKTSEETLSFLNTLQPTLASEIQTTVSTPYHLEEQTQYGYLETTAVDIESVLKTTTPEKALATVSNWVKYSNIIVRSINWDAQTGTMRLEMTLLSPVNVTGDAQNG